MLITSHHHCESCKTHTLIIILTVAILLLSKEVGEMEQAQIHNGSYLYSVATNTAAKKRY
jgi:hypothetical protein